MGDERGDAPLPPAGLRATEFRVEGLDLVVLSYPVEPVDLEHDTPLSSAEADVARLAIHGLSNAAIARRRGTSARTVANQMASILRKLNLSSRRELAARFTRADLKGRR